MDLRIHAPRSVHDRYCGVVMLARTVDKARAAAAGTLGEYEYDCPMDRAVFGFLGIEAERFLDAVRAAATDAELVGYVQPFVDRKPAAELARWNADFISYVPRAGSDSARRLREARDRLALDRTDIVTWADVIDLDEGRVVPPRAATV
jgi:hypothetical protein